MQFAQKARCPGININFPFLLCALMMLGFWHPAASAASAGSIAAAYQPYAELLDRFLIERKSENGTGLVTAFDYRDAINHPETKNLLKEQRERLREFDINSLDRKSRALSFWINAYNFFMLSQILENPRPDGEIIESVKDYGSFINPYRIFKKEIFNIGGERYSLDTMEKEILLGDSYEQKGWKEARVHFAVNCASVGCPPLRKKLYLPDNVDTLLTENTQMALQTSRHMRIEEDILYLSQLFEWYENDFAEEAGSIRAFLKQYIPADKHKNIEGAKSIRYIDYDWALNRPGNFPEISRTTARDHDDNRG